MNPVAHQKATSKPDVALGVPGRVHPDEQIVARAVERGEIPDVPRSPRVINLPFDLLMTMRPMSDEAIAEIVDEVWPPLLRS